MNNAACAHRTIKWNTQEVGGSTRGWWACEMCHMLFVPQITTPARLENFLWLCDECGIKQGTHSKETYTEMPKCKYGDPFCPCQDGDSCNHEEYGTGGKPRSSSAMTIEFYDIWRTVLIDSCRLFEVDTMYKFSYRTRENADRAIQVMALERILEGSEL